ncbi:hypothetical protein J4G33_15345 [Actinotalea sp. BY-33]|uniref:Uncharacterized protein n=1 Tax=Actinotalea soli TaxID=2819234 RepID=A0A939LXQ9_9CELL|nr:hypothetical protein [Actinotalea soli]MBO1753182.1 hypothetical protein [Actinotalea soli]
MENNTTAPDVAEAREALAAITTAQQAVRNTPWPTWIYPVNAALLAALALTALLSEDRHTITLAVMFMVVGINMTAGYRSGTPSAVPTSRGFLAAAAVAMLAAGTAVLLPTVSGPTWLIVVLAVVAAASYLLGGVAHRRSTRRTP